MQRINRRVSFSPVTSRELKWTKRVLEQLSMQKISGSTHNHNIKVMLVSPVVLGCNYHLWCPIWKISLFHYATLSVFGLERYLKCSTLSSYMQIKKNFNKYLDSAATASFLRYVHGMQWKEMPKQKQGGHRRFYRRCLTLTFYSTVLKSFLIILGCIFLILQRSENTAQSFLVKKWFLKWWLFNRFSPWCLICQYIKPWREDEGGTMHWKWTFTTIAQCWFRSRWLHNWQAEEEFSKGHTKESYS